MNILQIWMGNKPDKQLLNCMSSVINNSGKNNYILITESKWFNSYKAFKNKFIDYIDLNIFVKKMFNHNNNAKVVWDLIPSGSNNNWARADIIRFYFLSQYLHTLYCDTDIKLKYIPKFDDDKYYFGTYVKPYIDCNIIYNGNNINVFNNLFNACIDNYINTYKLFYGNIKYFPKEWAFQTFNKKSFRQHVSIIDPDCYEHLGRLKKDNK
jgi:hypothetical protein